MTNGQLSIDPIEEHPLNCRKCGQIAGASEIFSCGKAIGYRVFCDDCENMGPLLGTKNFAIACWNEAQL